MENIMFKSIRFFFFLDQAKYIDFDLRQSDVQDFINIHC